MAGPDETASATILLVDDDPVVRDTCAHFLRRAGYQVQVASDGREAQAFFRHSPACIELLVTDIEMPFLSGIDLADSAVASGSHCPVLLISGHPPPPEVAQKGWEFLPKPFSPPVLIGRVEQLLSKETGPRPYSRKKPLG